MAQRFCTVCGAVLSEGRKFCEQCGSPVAAEPVAPAPRPAGAADPGSVPEPAVPPDDGRKPARSRIIIAAVILLVIALGAFLLVLPLLSGAGTIPGVIPGAATRPPTQEPVTTASLPVTTVTVVTPSPTPDPFPAALRLKDTFTFGTGPVVSEANVYRIWINDTYEWHNDKDNRYYVQKPSPGNKFLFVFVHLQNLGDTRVWFPSSSGVRVYYRGATYTEDRTHYKPDKAADEEATPVEVKEVQYFAKLNGDEYAEDFGFSHGTELAYLYPGASNAVDGYIIYQVPRAFVPEEAYVTIPFNGKDTGIWRLG